MTFSSLRACASVTPGARRPIPWRYTLARSSRSPGVNQSGIHKVVVRVGNSNVGAITPTIRCGVPFSVSVAPSASARPPKSDCHRPSLNTTGGGPPLVSSAVTNVRPSRALTRSVSNRLVVTSAMSRRRGPAEVRALAEAVETAAIDANDRLWRRQSS